MSHEIRNPLQAILLQLEMLETTTLTGIQTGYVAGVTRASNVLLRIVNDILDVSKIEAGAVVLDTVEFSVSEVLEQTLAANAVTAVQKHLDLLCNVDPAMNPWVIGDPTRIRQVVHNFVSNALKFTEHGEVEVSVSQVMQEVDGNEGGARDVVEVEAGRSTRVKGSEGEGGKRQLWQVAVRDSGIGIDQRGQRKLFQQFSQVDETPTRSYGGTGLGLFICKELCGLMGGTVSVDSEPGVGSTFRATFMLEQSSRSHKPPPQQAPTTEAWTIVVYAQSKAFARSVAMYVRYYFAPCPFVKVQLVHKPQTAQQRAVAAAANASARHRMLFIARYGDCTRAMEKVLVGEKHPHVAAVAIADLTVNDAPSLEKAGWKHVVGMPFLGRRLCTALHRATASLIGTVGGRSGNAIAIAWDMGTGALGAPNVVLGAAEASHGDAPRGALVNEAPVVKLADGERLPAVLIVDDNELVRTLVRQTVRQLGYETIIACNGQEAVQVVQARYGEVGLVLMDCEMPVMDGYESTEAIRALEEARGVAPENELYICAMTANAMREDVEKCFRHRMSGFLAKPVKRADLGTVLQEHCPKERDDGDEERTATSTPSTKKKGKGSHSRPRKKKGGGKHKECASP